MTGDIVYWGSGEYDTNRDVSSAITEPTPGGILVDWGNSNTVTLPGEWLKTETYRDRWDFQYRSVRIRDGLPGNWLSSFVFSRKPPSFQDYVCYSSGLAQSRLLVLRNWYKGSVVTLCGVVVPWIFSVGNSASPWDDFWFVQVSVSASLDIRTFEVRNLANSGNITAYEVFSDGGSSLRYQTTPPTVTVLTAGCRIKITYSDNSIEYIPFDECPPWVKIRPDNECPEGSCRVECETHYCCYDSCTGAVTKVIPK
jgi:hypothetical protein